MNYAVRITLSAKSPVPAYTGGIWTGGVAKLSAGPRVTGWTSGRLLSCSPLGQKVDISQHGALAMLDSASIVISAVGQAAFDLAGASLYGALVEVGTISGTTLTPRWVGSVTDAPWSGAEVQISAEPVATSRYSDIPKKTLTRDIYPNAPDATDGKPVPMIYGAVERMKPPVLSSEAIPLTGCRVWSSSTAYVDSPTTHIYEAAGFTSTITSAPIVYAIGIAGIAPSSTNTGTWSDDIRVSDFVYMKVLSGTGSGQVRKISGTYRVQFTPSNVVIGAGSTLVSNKVNVLVADFFTPLDTALDATSSLSIYRIDQLARYAVADEGAGAQAYSNAKDGELPVATDKLNSGGIYIADIANEFISGEDVLSIEKIEATSVYGRSYLSDGITKSGSTAAFSQAQLCVNNNAAGKRNVLVADAICCGELLYSDFSNKIISDLYIVCSGLISPKTAAHASYPYVQAIAEDFMGVIHEINIGLDVPASKIGAKSFNAFSRSISSDGDPSNFNTSAYKAILPIPISAIFKIKFGVIASCDEPSQLYGYGYVFDVTKTSGSNIIRFTDNYLWALHTLNPHDPINARPIAPPGETLFSIDRGGAEIDNAVKSAHIAFTGLWKSAHSFVSDGDGHYQFSVDDASSWPNGTYTYAFLNTFDALQEIGGASEYETAVVVSYGSVTLSDILIGVQSGRTYSSAWPALPSGKSIGDPITTAPHAALDILYRDLGLGSSAVDAAAFLALPADAVALLVSEKQPASDVMDKLCQEFNWIVSNDGTGKETARSWLNRVGSTDYDYDVASGDVVSESFAGLELTAIEDLISTISATYSWTQADGARKTASVPDLSIAPASVTEANVSQYAPGFPTTALGVTAYGILYAAAATSGVTQAGDITYETTSDLSGLLVSSGRLAWGATRKPLATFSVSDSHAAAWAVIGERIKLQHRRYAATAVYGTLVARYWMPSKNIAQLTIMIDPPSP